jgi:very-short-patch-repair endonuclease
MDRRRQLREEASDAERCLWRALRNRQIAGAKFRRQHPVGPYILDFYCVEARLAIEADGSSHTTAEGLANDSVRTAYLKARGIQVLRFTNIDILNSTEVVVDTIHEAIVVRLSR